MKQKVTGYSTLRQAHLELNTMTSKETLNTLCVMFEMGKERVNTLIAKHRRKLNQKVKEALAQGWK